MEPAIKYCKDLKCTAITILFQELIQPISDKRKMMEAADCTCETHISLDEEGRRHCDNHSPHQPSDYGERGRPNYLTTQYYAGLYDVRICWDCGEVGCKSGLEFSKVHTASCHI
jgi:hypothetical protein